MLSGVVPVLYALTQAIVDFAPSVPAMGPETEFPWSLFDGLSRAYLLCNLIPPAVTANASPLIASSPWTLLITSLVRDPTPYNLTVTHRFLDHRERRLLLRQLLLLPQPYLSERADAP